MAIHQSSRCRRIMAFPLASKHRLGAEHAEGTEPKDQSWKWVPALDVNYWTVAVKTSSIAVTVPLLGTSQLGGSSCSRLSVQIGWETPSKETRPS